MFSNLGPLFKTQFRQAESNDTRQSIPHQERDNHRRNNAEDEQTASPEEAWTDDTTVSIFALRSFLIDFLKTIPGGADSSLIAQVQEKQRRQQGQRKKFVQRTPIMRKLYVPIKQWRLIAWKIKHRQRLRILTKSVQNPPQTNSNHKNYAISIV